MARAEEASVFAPAVDKLVRKYYKEIIMETKPTSKPDKDVIKKVKKYTPLVEELSGIITLEKDFNHKEEYCDYLIEKYSRTEKLS